MSAFKGQFGYLDAEKIGYGYVIVGMSKTVMFRPNDAPFFFTSSPFTVFKTF